MRILVVVLALAAGCAAQSPAELDLVAAGPDSTLVVLKGATVVAVTPAVGGTDNSWSWSVTKKPSSSLLSAAWGGSQWQFAPDVDGDYRICATHEATAPDLPPVITKACGSLSAIEHISVARTHVHVERERALLAGSFSLAATSNESVTFQTGSDGVIASASGTIVGKGGGDSADAGPGGSNVGTAPQGPVDITNTEFSGPVTSTALGTLTCRLLGVPGPTAVCPTTPDTVPPLGDHLHWQAHVVGDVATEPAVAAVDGDVVASAPATAPHLTSLTLSNHGAHFKATISPAVTDETVTIELRSFDKSFAGGFAQVKPSSTGAVEGDLTTLGHPPAPARSGSYDVVTLVVSSQGDGIATLTAVVRPPAPPTRAP